LIVDDDVKRPADRVARKLAEVEGLLHDPFASEGRIAVDQQRKATDARPVAATVLFGAQTTPQTGLTNSRWLGLKAKRQVDFCGASSSCPVATKPR